MKLIRVFFFAVLLAAVFDVAVCVVCQLNPLGSLGDCGSSRVRRRCLLDYQRRGGHGHVRTLGPRRVHRMSDLRARIADALHHELDEHDYEDDDEKRGQVAHHFADVLLSLPGIAVVDPNDPETIDRDVGHKAIWRRERHFKYDSEGNAIVVDVVERHRNMARAALLAAADAAEVPPHDPHRRQ
jgi:hypothetical protein